jgi:hypothetical protein
MLAPHISLLPGPPDATLGLEITEYSPHLPYIASTLAFVIGSAVVHGARTYSLSKNLPDTEVFRDAAPSFPDQLKNGIDFYPTSLA